MSALPSIPMLPHEVPRDPIHKEIVEALVEGAVTPRQVMPLFMVPGLGFHRSLYTLTLHIMEYRLAGHQTFVIPEGMQKALAQTSMVEIQGEDIHVPYKSQYISLPGCGLEIWGGDQTRWHKVGGAFIRFSQGEDRIGIDGEGKHYLKYEAPEDDPGMLNLYLWGMENELSHGPGDDASLWVTLDLYEIQKRNIDLETYVRDILWDPERDETNKGFSDLAVEIGMVTTMPKDSRGKRAKENIVTVLRIIFNALLYLDSQDAEMEMDPTSLHAQKERERITKALARIKNPKRSRGRKLNRQLKKLPPDRVVWVGQSVHLGTINEEEAEDTPDKAPRRGRRRGWVRGHWWPRRDTIKRKVAEAAAEEQRQLEAYRELQQAVTSMKDAEDIATHVPRLASLRAQYAEVKDQAQQLAGSLDAKRRWVKPYITPRLSTTEQEEDRATIASHVYVLGQREEA